MFTPRDANTETKGVKVKMDYQSGYYSDELRVQEVPAAFDFISYEGYHDDLSLQLESKMTPTPTYMQPYRPHELHVHKASLLDLDAYPELNWVSSYPNGELEPPSDFQVSSPAFPGLLPQHGAPSPAAEPSNSPFLPGAPGNTLLTTPSHFLSTPSHFLSARCTAQGAALPPCGKTQNTQSTLSQRTDRRAAGGNLSRGLRYYYHKNIIHKTAGKRYVYRFVCDMQGMLGRTAQEVLASLNVVQAASWQRESESTSEHSNQTWSPQ
ncbi:hypothetical protein CRUP_019623 [Coryphaenoides rupestris]|nr:hypothetical protein CRUP_019623 [Coryphaenoides rupestris]